MPIYVGEREGEEERVTLILASNASLDKAPNNSNTKFTNFLAEEIINKDQDQPHLLMRISKVYIPCGLVPEDHLPKTEANDILQIRIDQIHSQVVNSQREQIAAVFDLRQNDPRVEIVNQSAQVDESTSSMTAPTDYSIQFPYHNERNYIVREFNHSPLLQVADRTLKRLSFHLTQLNGETYPLQDNLPPTIIQVEIFSIKMHQPENTVYCVSHLARDRVNLYPKNSLTDFKSKLPHPIDVSDYEMCLSSITMPALPSPHNLYVKLQIFFHRDFIPPNNPQESMEIVSVKIEPEMNKREIIRQLNLKIQEVDFLKNKMASAYQGLDQESSLRFYVQNRVRNAYLSVRWNELGCMLFGFPRLSRKTFTIPPTDQMEAGVHTRRTAHRDQIISREKCAQVRQLFIPDIALLYCDIVKASPVGDSMAQLLEIIPLSQFIREKNHKNSVNMYTPYSAKFKALGATKISEIYFRILRADGEPIVFPPINNTTMANSGGTIIEVKFRRKAKKPQSVQEMGEKNMGDISLRQSPEEHYYRSDWKRNLLLQNVR